MTSTNEITGDKLQSKVGNKKAYDDGYDRIFSKEARVKLRAVEECNDRHGPCQLHDGCVDECPTCTPS